MLEDREKYLQIRKFSRDKIKTNETVRRFYSAVKEGSVDAFIRTLTLWWAPLVQHPKHILQGELDASTRAKLRLADAEAPVELTWKYLYERHSTFRRWQQDCHQGDPLPDMTAWERSHGQPRSILRNGVFYFNFGEVW